MDFHEIIERKLWIGGKPSKQDLIQLRDQLGSEMIVMDLVKDEKEKGLCEELGIEYDARTPEVVLAEDNSVPLGKLKVVAMIIGDNIDAGRKVVLHCTYGKGRSPTCAAAYLIINGMSAQSAMETVSREASYWQGADANYAKALTDLAKIVEITRG